MTREIEPATTVRTVLWQRLDRLGLDALRIERHDTGWRLLGTALVVDADRPCRLDYDVACDPAWRTRRTRISGWIGARPITIVIEADGAGHWHRDGEPQPQVAGCLDVDLGFTPKTNTLPICRLSLPVGAGILMRYGE